MLETSRAEEEGSSPLATVEEIQRRLVRPSSLTSPISTIKSRNSCSDDVEGRCSSQFQMSLTEIGRKGEEDEREMAKRKLEDYLDPVLLSAISSKLKRKQYGGETKLTRISTDFEWPVEELKAFMDESRIEKRRKWISKAAVDLNADLEEAIVEEDEEPSTPFRRFEETVLKLFKE
ncbi:hypothetical protein HHK36_018407 [Tetracentron sinense]|uniref:Uncharacterized protein n=1 Tax=Tetracentron sinense TaxID=13715 RepID=A0A834YZI2_TETSI|nr:hypothetical protein HHK36_018407 [Tetracentron sinense]